MTRRLLTQVGLTLVLLAGPHRVLAQSPARQAGYLYLSPVPGASYVSAQTRDVLVRFEAITPAQVTNLTTGFITVVGTNSGPHLGPTRVASDGRTVIFETGADFTPNELVTVTLNPQVQPSAGGSVQPYQYQFMVTAPMPGSSGRFLHTAKALVQPQVSVQALPNGDAKTSRTKAPVVKRSALAKALVMTNGVSVPSDFPQVAITVNNKPSPGYLFLENGLDLVPPYTMLLDNNGLPVWYSQGRMYDFKVQKNGMITWAVSDDTGFPAFDQNFSYLKTYLTTNGYNTDSHELKILPDGTYFMIGYRTNIVDMSLYFIGGIPGSIVRETVVQMFTPAGDLVLQWRAWDYYDLADMVGTTGDADFPHMNGIDIDEDGNILVSARHLSEVTKINRDSGDIMWRLSGAHSSFSFVNDPFYGTSFQHNISALGNGHYMVFDNGNYHTPQISRAVEYQLDLTNMTATVAWQFRDTPDKYTFWCGDAQRLPNGNTFIDFVRPEYPKAIEVDTNGVKQFELSLVPGSDSYRAFRFPWSGVVAAPYLVVEPQADNITLIFNKFGDHNVAYYRIYGGLTPNPTTLLDESTTTLKQLSNLQNGLYYFHVTAVSNDGVESPASNEVQINVNIVAPGQNQVQNGGFSGQDLDWALLLNGGAVASWTFANGVSHFNIVSGGAALSDIQLLQGGQNLAQGSQYVLEFDAWSSETRYIGVELGQNAPPWTAYSEIAPPFLTPNRTHYRYVFTMQQPSDSSADVLFNLGSSTADVYLDNVNLFQVPVGDLNQDGRVDLLDLSIFVGNWLKQSTGILGDLKADGRVDFTDFSIMGQNWTPGGP